MLKFVEQVLFAVCANSNLNTHDQTVHGLDLTQCGFKALCVSNEEWLFVFFLRDAQVGKDYYAYKSSVSWPLASDLNDYHLFIFPFTNIAQLLRRSYTSCRAKVIKRY